jgi:heme-degrading monooxygenase HmoA
MIAVLFELEARPGAEAAYFDTAAELRPLLDGIDGFISVERFQSLTRPGRYLSLSYWRDEEAVRAWRNQAQHRAAQQTGRTTLFADYRLRVAAILRDYGLHDRAQAPGDAPQGLI